MSRSFLVTILLLIYTYNFAYADFPIGIYGVDNPEDIAIIKKAGFNCIQTYKGNPEIIKKLATEAKKQDIKLLIYPYNIINSKYEKEADAYPILAWYLCDEPDIWKVSREKLTSLNEKSKKTFPNHKTAFVIGQGETEIPYYDIADILMVDWYPVPHLSLESFGENISLAKQSLKIIGRDNTPLWAVVQIFDWKEYKQYRSDDNRIGRFPSKDEIRFMSYDAVFNGATGLFYFIYTSKGIPLPKSKPEQWKDIVDVIQELSFTSNIFDKGIEIKNIVDIEKPLKAKSFNYQGIKYIIIINPTSKTQRIPAIFSKSNFDVIYESNTDLKEVFDNRENKFPPYHVFVFRYN